MSEHSLSKEVMLLVLPHVLRQDPNMYALAESISGALAGRREELSLPQLYQRIDELGEDLLDILAYDFKIDWWNGDYPVENKRNLLKTNWQIHRTLGTKAAVVTALKALYDNVEITEWYEYGGYPYCFRIVITLSDDETMQWSKVKQTVMMYKRESAHLDHIIYTMTNETPAQLYGGAARAGYMVKYTVNLPGRIETSQSVQGYIGTTTGSIRTKATVQVAGSIENPAHIVTAYTAARAKSIRQQLTVYVEEN